MGGRGGVGGQISITNAVVNQLGLGCLLFANNIDYCTYRNYKNGKTIRTGPILLNRIFCEDGIRIVFPLFPVLSKCISIYHQTHTIYHHQLCILSFMRYTTKVIILFRPLRICLNKIRTIKDALIKS